MTRLYAVALALAALTFPARGDDAADNDSKKSFVQGGGGGANDDLTLLLMTLNGAANGQGLKIPIHELTGRLERRLEDRSTAEATAKQVLEHRREYEISPVVEQRLDAMAREGKRVTAAELWLQCLRAHLVVKTLGRGGVAIGRVAVEDGKVEPEMILAQMPILEGGFFAGEVGNLSKSIRFRAAGYAEADVALEGKPGPIVDVGTVVLKPLSSDQAASFKAQVALDIPERGPAAASISLTVPKANMPYFGVTPRKRWPDPTPVTIGKDGILRANGLTPGEYFLQITAKDHATYTRVIKLTPGKELDRGTIRLYASDLGHFIGKAAPAAELTVEKSVDAALARAARERRPVILVMALQGCPLCLAFGTQTLAEPWIKHFLSPFIVVTSYQDEKLEAKYSPDTYPTIVFLNADGHEVHRTSGDQPPAVFLGRCVKAFKALDRDVPEELQLLVDRKVVAGK